MSLKTFAETAAEHAAILKHAIFLVAGLTGGCYVAAYAYIRGRPMTAYLVAAYCTIGMVMATTTGIGIKMMLNVELGWEQSFLVGTVTAVMGVLSVAGLNFRASLKIPYTDKSANLSIGEDNKND